MVYSIKREMTVVKQVKSDDRSVFDGMLQHVDSEHYFCSNQFKALRQLLLKSLTAEIVAAMTDDEVVKAIDGRYLCLMTWGNHSILVPRSSINELYSMVKIV